MNILKEWSRPSFHTMFLWFFAFVLFLQTLMTKPAIEVGMGILGALAVGYFFYTRTRPTLPRRITIVSALVIGFIGISCFFGIYAPDAQHQILRWVGVFGVGTLLIAFVQTVTLPTRSQWFAVLIAFATGIVYMISADQTDYILQYAIKGPGFNPTDLNKPIGVMTMMAPALLAPLLTAPRKHDQQIALALFALLAGVVIPSFSQSALLSLVAMVLCYFMPVAAPVFWRLVRGVTIMGLFGLPFIMTPLYNHYADTLKHTDVMREAASAERLEIWSAISQRILERPVFGWGYNAARILEMPIANVYFHDPIVAHPHDFVMQIWLESGAVGAVLAAVLFTLLWRGIEREENLDIRRLYFTSCASVIAFALVGWNMWQTWWVMTLFLVGVLTLLAARIIRAGGFPQSVPAPTSYPKE